MKKFIKGCFLGVVAIAIFIGLSFGIHWLGCLGFNSGDVVVIGGNSVRCI
jgi:hypothetical protein